ncbi:MAG: outer membrane beta-barrel protein [Verrucomicrobia bacterium]|nr:outer membrane beta-barrel protein [Verrucomicrobiota bacterium]
MKRLLTSAGLVAFGAANLQAQHAAAPHLTSIQTTKPWSVSASLRGFYDDNYVTRPSNSPTGLSKTDSFGFELNPSVGFNWVLPQTYVGLSYSYGLRYYEDRESNSADHTHQADLKISHAFSEQYKLDVNDSFVAAQEPELLAKPGGGIPVPIRVEGDNIRNTATANLNAGLTEKLGALIGYSNTYYDYEKTGIGSLSALLDRTEHLFTINGRWQAMPSTVGILGYQYGMNHYDEDQIIGFAGVGGPPVRGDARDSTSHYIYAGADHSFNPQLNGSLRAGAQITDYDNVTTDSKVIPYADASATWTYNPGSYVRLGVRHTRMATDVALITAASPTLDQEATTAYGEVNHKITAKLNGNLIAQYQHGSFEGGAADSKAEDLFLIGLNVSYEINKFLAAEAGYNYDRLDSDLEDRSFTRNRVYIGIRATY